MGRLVAAERNALAAIELAKKVSSQNATHKTEIAALKQQVVQLQQQNGVLNGRIAGMIGSGATQR